MVDLVRLAKAPLRLLLKEPARRLVRHRRARRSLAPERLDGTLALHGGLPVRDTRWRPWPRAPLESRRGWWLEVAPELERIFREGREGLPQPLSRRFAERWARLLGARHALLLPHGTDALRLALAAALDTDGLEHGGEVIVPNLSFVASTNAALDRRLGVALVDVDPETLLLDPERVEEAIVPGRTRAILPVHLFGQPCDMARLQDVARRHGLAIVEDAAQAHGAIHELGRPGTLGDAAAFSFQSFKNLAAGEGGALVTDDPALFERAYALHDVGRRRGGGQRWAHESLGWNVRPSEYVAAVLLHRLGRLEEESERRARRAAELRAELEDLSAVRPLGLAPGLVRHGVHMFVLRYAPEACGGLSLEGYLDALRAEGLPVGTLYNGATQSQQPALRRIAERRPEYLRVLPTPVADEAARRILWLPHDLFLGSQADVREIAAAFRKVERHYRPAAGIGFEEPHVSPAAGAIPEVGSNGTSHRPRVVRVGLVGAGAMGRLHAAALARCGALDLVAVADPALAAAQSVAAEHGGRAFAAAEELLEGGDVDLVVVAVPHLLHPEVALPALRLGLHVVCEKPLAVSPSEADALLQAAEAGGGLFAVVHQSRLEPVYREARALLASGELGPLVRASVVESAWRSRGYFDAAPWRGTWSGEGGGVLVNQAPHALDRYAWLCGLPETVWARCDTNLHAIEVEDTASALLRHAGGAHGHVHVSTAEAPPLARTSVVCDRGRVEVLDGRLFVTRLERPLSEVARDGRASARLRAETRELLHAGLGTIPAQLDAFYANVAAALAGRAELACPGREALAAVELAAAITLSSARGEPVHLPVDRAAYDRFLAERTAAARPVAAGEGAAR